MRVNETPIDTSFEEQFNSFLEPQFEGAAESQFEESVEAQLNRIEALLIKQNNALAAKDVVLCQDCLFYTNWHHCNKLNRIMKENDFCSLAYPLSNSSKMMRDVNNR